MGVWERGGDASGWSDEQLIRHVARTEVAPLEVLYERHSAAALSLARRMLGSQERAEDAVQDAYLALWRGAGGYDASKASVRTWLLGIVRNRSIDLLRKMDVHDRRRLALDGFEERISGADDVAADVVRRDDATRVRAALALLPIEHRRVLELAYFSGWTHTEIAEHLGVPLGTVKGRMRLAMSKLSSELADRARSPG
jgi:RNA polymerase sigma-70 factor, ECF subfamily